MLTIEGTSVNNTESGNWAGVNIPRSESTAFYYRNNSVTSINSEGYLLQAGDDVQSSRNNNLDGMLITGNKFTWNGTGASSIIHGLFTGYNINSVVKYNYLDKTPHGILFKSGTGYGFNMTNTSGGAAYNIVKNARLSLRIKRMNGVRVYNNTFYNDAFAEWQALGYDTHSVVVNPGFVNTNDFVPASRLDCGTDLGAEFQTGLSESAVWSSYNPAIAAQNGPWQPGARVFTPDSGDQIIKIYPNPAYNHIYISIKEPTVVLDYIRIINLSRNIVFQDEVDPDVREFQIRLNLLPGY